MAEVLVAVSAVVSVAQLLVYVAQTAKVVTKFCNAVHDAPAQVNRLMEKLDGLQNVVKESQSCDNLVSDNTVLPPDLRQTLLQAVMRTRETIDRIQKRLESSDSVSRGLRQRIKWASIARHRIEQEMHELEHCEYLLDRVLQLINLRSTLLCCLYSKRCTELAQQLNRDNIGSTAARSPGYAAQISVYVTRVSAQRTARLICWKQTILSTDHWFRSLGFYGSFTAITQMDTESIFQIQLGFKMPSWLYSGSVDLRAEFTRLSEQQIGIKILESEIKIQSRVPMDSSFMIACKSGNVKLIKQHLLEKTGSVRDRTLSTGSTPLLMAIEGDQFEAMNFLLDSGADPNVCDDSQTLPLFALLGMNNSRGNEFVRQLPPKRSLWLDAFRLMVEKDASVHEVNHNKSLVHLNISHESPGQNPDYTEPNALDFFHILHDHCFMDFKAPGPDLWSPVLTAIRRKTKSTETRRFLAKIGVDLSRIATSGHSSLHWAAEMAYEMECVEYLCQLTASENVNRQDLWGWTPLHYAVASGRYGFRNLAMDKIKRFLHHGADPNVKGRRHPIFFARVSLMDEFTPLELSLQVDPGLSILLEGELLEVRLKHLDDNSDETFFDAVEIQATGVPSVIS